MLIGRIPALGCYSEGMPFLASLDAGDASLGGKARSLATLAALGFATPPSFVVTDAVFRALCPDLGHLADLDTDALATLDRARATIEGAAWPPAFPEELRTRLEALAENRFSVRSSFVGEDALGALAAGVYESCVDVAAEQVEAAVRCVLGSAISPGAVAYAMAHGRKPGDGPCAVLIHAYLPGKAEGSAAFAPATMAAPMLMLRRGELPPSASARLETELARLALAMGPVEVEWVFERGDFVFLQARPFQAPPNPADWPGWHDLPDGHDVEAWRWDAAHNPLPLSPAQSGLVELVDDACRIGWRQRVLGGYLFYSSDGRSLPPGIDTSAASAYYEGLRREFEEAKDALGASPALEPALALFTSMYERIFGVLQPALKQARRELHDFLQNHAPEEMPLLPALGMGVPSVAEERARRAAAIRQAITEDAREQARAAYLARFGDEAPIWDVASPTYSEDPSPLRLAPEPLRPQASPSDWRQAAASVEGHLPEAEQDRWRRLLGLAREAISLSEADDWLYARAQAVVRHALLNTGLRLQVEGRLAQASDVLFLPLPLVRQLDGKTDVDLAAIAAAGRSAWEKARQSPPPAAASSAGKDLVVRGHGTGGRTVGRIAIHDTGRFRPLPDDAVVLAHTLLPTELPLIAAAALVTETGGPLDHVAAQARERGIPAVIGALGASRLLREGDRVLVDGERGLVVRLGRV